MLFELFGLARRARREVRATLFNRGQVVWCQWGDWGAVLEHGVGDFGSGALRRQQATALQVVAFLNGPRLWVVVFFRFAFIRLSAY